MVDIAKCSGVNCPIRDRCNRFSQYSSNHDIINHPYKIENGVFSCDLFWGESQTQMLNQLEEIVGIQKQHK